MFMHFPHLNQLNLNLLYTVHYNRADTYVKSLRMNPQLRCLSLVTQFNMRSKETKGFHELITDQCQPKIEMLKISADN